MKKLFTNYNFEFNKNEKRLLNTFLKQTIKQMGGDSKFYAEEKSFTSILTKINADTEQVKLTKDELTRLRFQLENNLKYIKKQMEKAWFLKKWLYKSMMKQYESIIDTHFKG